MTDQVSLVLKANKFYKNYKDKEEVWRYGELVVTILVIAFFIIFAIRPTVKAISTLLSEIDNKQELSQKMASKINQVITAQTNYANVQQDINYLDQAYPQFPQLAEGAAQLVGLGIEKSLLLESLSFSEASMLTEQKKEVSSQAKQKTGVSFSVSFSGDYQNIKLFLTDLRLLRRVFVINNYSISIPKDVPASGWVNLSLAGLLPYYQQ
jgi:Tfp pilus assembly protein PilO